MQANAASTNGGHRVPVEVPAENRTLWQCIQDMFTFEAAQESGRELRAELQSGAEESSGFLSAALPSALC